MQITIEVAGRDPKDWTADPRPRIYVPPGAPTQFEYYEKIAKDHPELRLDVQMLPAVITPDYVMELNDKPGLLALAMEKKLNESTGETDLVGVPFVVPGGRFNELYGWDSYMESLGLLVSDRDDLAKGMVFSTQTDLTTLLARNHPSSPTWHCVSTKESKPSPIQRSSCAMLSSQLSRSTIASGLPRLASTQSLVCRGTVPKVGAYPQRPSPLTSCTSSTHTPRSTE